MFRIKICSLPLSQKGNAIAPGRGQDAAHCRLPRQLLRRVVVDRRHGGCRDAVGRPAWADDARGTPQPMRPCNSKAVSIQTRRSSS